jgi:hypothetical protein
MPADHEIHQLSPTFFRKWLKAIFGVEEKSVHRVTSLLRHTRFRDELKFFTGTRYGQQHATLGCTDILINHKLDYVSMGQKV